MCLQYVNAHKTHDARKILELRYVKTIVLSWQEVVDVESRFRSAMYDTNEVIYHLTIK